jgi:enoyl-CoA hydratase/carnithine racemase
MPSPQNPPVRLDLPADGIAVLTLDDPERAANTMTDAFTTALTDALDRLEAAREDLHGVLLTSAKRSFFAGGDLDELARITPETADHARRKLTAVKAQLRRLELLGRPVVALLHGSALGGGLELALACHHRIALGGPEAAARSRFGFPEVGFGLLPAAGGVTRTVRLLGLTRALDALLLRGRQLTPAEALDLGLIGQLADTPEESEAAARTWIAEHPDAQQPWDTPGHRTPSGTPAQPADARELPILPALLAKSLRGAPYPAPHHILCAAVEGSQLDLDSAFTLETRWFLDLATGQTAKNLIHALHTDRRALAASGARPTSAAPPTDAADTATRLANASEALLRMLDRYLGEGLSLLVEGMPAASVEQAAQQAGYPSGVLRLLDELAPAGFRPASGSAVLAGMDEELGRIAFYDHPPGGGEPRLWPGLPEAFGLGRPSGPGPVPFADAKDRLLLAPALEAFRCLAEGVIASPAAANIESIFGLGYPAWTGGAVHIATQYPGGPAGFAARARQLAHDYGERFAPPQSLLAAVERDDPA